MIIVRFSGHSPCTISHPRYRPQKRQLIRGGLVVVKNDMPQQGKSAGTVIGQTHQDLVDSLIDSTGIMTLADLAAYLKCHPNTIYRLAWNGDIPSFRVGSDWRFRRSDITSGSRRVTSG